AEWCTPGLPSALGSRQTMPLAPSAEATSRLERNEVIRIVRAGAGPDERKLLDLHACESLMLLPIVSEQSLIGVIAFAARRGARAWSDEEIAFLQRLAELFATAIERHRAFLELRDSEVRYRALFERHPNPMFVYDLATLHFLA